MSRESRQRIHYVYNIFLSITIIIAGLCLMASCIVISQSGTSFSRESVAAAFSKIAFPVYLCIASVIGSIILQIVFPDEGNLPASVKQYHMLLRRLHRTCDLQKADAALQKAVLSEQRIRRIYQTICIVFFIFGTAVFLLYAGDPSNYHSANFNESIIQAMFFMIPCLGIPFVCSVISAFLCRTSIRREINILTQAVSDGCRKSVTNCSQKKTGINRLLLGRLIFLVAGICITLYGLWTGGTMDVLTKAINICTECIGLG